MDMKSKRVIKEYLKTLIDKGVLPGVIMTFSDNTLSTHGRVMVNYITSLKLKIDLESVDKKEKENELRTT